MDANVKSKIVDVQNSESPLSQFYKKTGIDKQNLALVSPAGEVLQLEINRQAGNFREEIWTMLEQVISSPIREQVLEKIVKSYGIVLIVESEDVEANQLAFKMVNEAIEEIKTMMASMPKPVDVPPEIIVMENKNIKSEQILLWSLGYENVKESLPAITVLYGRGRQMGRLLPSEIIKSNIIRNLLAFVGADCECGLDRSWILGRMMPIRWELDKQRKVIQYHQFDAENPLTQAEMAQILSISPSKQRTENNADLSAEGIYGYTEKEIKLVTSSPGEEAGQQSVAENSPLTKSLIIISVFFLVVIIAGFIFYKRNRKVV